MYVFIIVREIPYKGSRDSNNDLCLGWEKKGNNGVLLVRRSFAKEMIVEDLE